MALRDLFVRIKGDNSDLKKTFKDTANETEGFVSKVKGIGTSLIAAAAAGAGAFKVLIDWVKDTSYGISAMNVGLAVAKQALTDLIMGQGSNLKEAARISREKSQNEQDDIKRQYEAKQLQSELNQLIVASADQTKTHAERLDALTKAMQKQKDLKALMLFEAKEELQFAYDNWKINLASVDAKKAFYEAAGKVREIEGMDSRRLQSQFTSQLVAQRKEVDDLRKAFQTYEQDAREAFGGEIIKNLDILNGRMKDLTGKMSGLDSGTASGRFAIKELRKEINWLQEEIDHTGKENILQKITGFSAEGIVLASKQYHDALAQIFGFSDSNEAKTRLAPGPNSKAKNTALFSDMGDPAENWKKSWESAIQDVTNLMSDQFIKVFEDIGKGSFAGFGDDMLKSFGSLVANLGKMLMALGTTMLLAQTLLKTPSIPTAIAAIAAGAAAMAIGGMMMGAASQGLSGGGSSSGGGGGSYRNNPSQLKEQLIAKVNGKSLDIVLKRYYADNG
jgi:hypothetical protein